MALDPILSEVRRIREAYAQQFHGDVRAMMDDLRRRHARSNRQSVSLGPKLRRPAATLRGKAGAKLYDTAAEVSALRGRQDQ
jgi:hypothetical protein